PLQDDRVLYDGQPLALVVADTLERAIEAARLVRIDYREEPFETDFTRRLERAEKLAIFGWPPDQGSDDAAAAWRASPHKLEHTYRTADRHHNAMEPSATLAIWRDGVLTLHDAVQGLMDAR